MNEPATISEWEPQFRGSVRFHMLQCWLDSFQATGTITLPGCGVTDAFAEGRAAEWTVYVSKADAVRIADAGRAFVSDHDAVNEYERSAAAASTGCQRAAEACAETALQHGVPHPRTADAFLRYFEAYTVLQGHFQATSPLHTCGAEADLDAAVQERVGGVGTSSLPPYSGRGGLKAIQETSEWWLTLLAARRQEWTPQERDDVLRRHVDRFLDTGAIEVAPGTDPFTTALRRWRRDDLLTTREMEVRAMRAAKDVRECRERRRNAAREMGLDPHDVAVAAHLDLLGLRRMAIRNATSETTQVAYSAFERVFALVDGDLDPVDGVRQLSRDEVVSLVRGDKPGLDAARERLDRGLYGIHGAERVSLYGAAAESVIARYHARRAAHAVEA